jgi:hypothetical protein
MTNDIDTLMTRVAEINKRDLPLSADDIDILIAGYRAQRARRAAGEKPYRPKAKLEDMPELAALVQPPKPAFTLKRRPL